CSSNDCIKYRSSIALPPSHLLCCKNRSAQGAPDMNSVLQIERVVTRSPCQANSRKSTSSAVDLWKVPLCCRQCINRLFFQQKRPVSVPPGRRVSRSLARAGDQVFAA